MNYLDICCYIMYMQGFSESQGFFKTKSVETKGKKN